MLLVLAPAVKPSRSKSNARVHRLAKSRKQITAQASRSSEAAEAGALISSGLGYSFSAPVF